MFFFFVALVGLFSFTFAFPTPVDYNTNMTSTDENVGNKLVFCHFMASDLFLVLSYPAPYTNNI